MMGKLVNFCAGADKNKRPVQANNYLLNAAEYGSSGRRIEKAKSLVQAAQPQCFMLDSGGYPLLNAEQKGWKITHDQDRPLIYRKGEINLTPRHVMECASILKPDIVFALDFPVGKFKTDDERGREFSRKLPVNDQWAHESAEWHRRLCPEAKLFQPVQAYRINHLDTFFMCTTNVRFDGVAMPVREAKLHEIALFMTSFVQRGFNQVHLLGTASFLKIAMFAFFAGSLFDWVSLDATSWNSAAIRGGFLSQKNLSRIDLRPNRKLDPGFCNDCPCPFCSGQSFTEIQGMPKKQKFELLRQHNWWAIDRVVTDLEKNSSNLQQLERFLKNRNANSVEIDNLINTLALVDCLKNDDIEVLETILGPISKRWKSTERSRNPTDPILAPRKQTKLYPDEIQTCSSGNFSSDPWSELEQNKKIKQEDKQHVE